MRWFSGRQRGHGLLPLAETLEALGDTGVMERRRADVPLADVVGTVSRPHDFDDRFRLLNRGLEDRWSALATAVESGFDPPPVDLVQLGEVYFVTDGHHRVSVACSLRRPTISANVLRVCTIAYAMCCLRLSHLPSKAAERRFLQRVPLPDEVRVGLWLDRPADWMRLADAAEAWAFRRSLARGRLLGRCELARVWWTEEVAPVVRALRATGIGVSLRDVQLYVAALGAPDGLPGQSAGGGKLSRAAVTRRDGPPARPRSPRPSPRRRAS